MKNTIGRILALTLTLLLLASTLSLAVLADEELWDGSARTFKMKAGEEKSLIYIPAADGPYTISQSTSVIRTSFEQADFTDKDAEPIPVHVEGKANANDECYRLKGGVRYLVKISMSSAYTEWPEGLSDTISIYAGEPKKEADLCTPFPNNGKLTLTVKPGEEFKYKFTPSSSGTYALYGINTVINVRLRCGPESLDMPDNQLFVANPFGNAFGYIADMTAGETYIITFSVWENESQSFTDTYYLEKVTGMKSAELRSAFDHTTTDLFGYVGGSIQLFPYTDPLYYEALTTQWTVSDPSVAQFITEDSKQTRELALKKAGTVTVTATVNGQAVSETITVKERPVLEMNQTTKLTFGGTTGVQCAFTPTESGYYRFAMTGAGGTTTIMDTNYGTYWEGSGALTANLTAGKTYILEGAFGPSDYTVRVSKGSASDPTNPLPSGDEPTDPTESVTQTQTQPTTDKQPDHKVPVHKENGKAQVKYEDVAHLLDATDTLTVTVEDTAVTTVTLPTQALTEAAQADTALRVELPHATVVLDAAILTKVARQADGETVELTVEQVDASTLSKQQQKTLKNKEVAGVVRILLGGENEIHELGGTAAVTVPFTPESDKALADYVVYYLDGGKLEKMKTVVTDEGLTFFTTHFSDYTLVYEPQADNTDKPTLDIGAVVLYSILALVILAGGGVAIWFISKRPAHHKNH